MAEFREFPKIPRYSREVIVTEKIDGTNGCIYIGEDGLVLPGSRSRWLTDDVPDNFGFRAWVRKNQEELLKLGVGTHFGEWWGQGIQRGYGLTEKRFSLFNVTRWEDVDKRPDCCSIVPILAKLKRFDDFEADGWLEELMAYGSKAAPGFMKPEGIVVYHVAGNLSFKKTIERDDEWKGKQNG